MFWHFFGDLNVYYSLQFPPWLRVLLVVRETFLMLLKSVLQVSWQWQLEQMLTRESLIPIIHCPSLPRRPSAVAEDISQQPSESQVKVPGLPVSCMGELWKLKLKVLFGKTVTVHFPRDLTSSLCCTEWIYFIYLFFFVAPNSVSFLHTKDEQGPWRYVFRGADKFRMPLSHALPHPCKEMNILWYYIA